MDRIGFGGGCHWCTEAVFLSLKGVRQVQQGWLSAIESKSFSEGVIVCYEKEIIDIPVLIGVHLYTHSSTSNHKMRGKYRSAIYVFNEEQAQKAQTALAEWQQQFHQPLTTRIIHFEAFRASAAAYVNYYYKAPEKPFCTLHIHPKLKTLLEMFSEFADTEKINKSLT